MARKRSYSEMLKYDRFGDRLKYLELWMEDHPSPRDINNMIFHSQEWLTLRPHIITRDYGNDLGVKDCPIHGRILIHHINPITEEDIMEHNVDKLFNPENLISTSYDTHGKIHYRIDDSPIVERKPNDMKLW